MASYFDNDYDYESWSLECQQCQSLPAPTVYDERNVNDAEIEENSRWNKFYGFNNSGKFYKPRRYLVFEFGKYVEDCLKCEAPIFLEAGCGHGSTVGPIMSHINNLNISVSYYATDYSLKAIEILRENSSLINGGTSCHVWDILQCCPLHIKANILLSIFVLSAVAPANHRQALCNMKDALAPGGVILYRDYGLHDMTMYRHGTYYGGNFFRRNDGTLVTYYDVAGLRELAEGAGLTVLELQYATVQVKNRKQQVDMKRVFLHAVLLNPS